MVSHAYSSHQLPHLCYNTISVENPENPHRLPRFGTKLLVFGFLYNMRDHCDAVQVLKVEDVVNSSWFQDAVEGQAAQVETWMR